MSMLKEFKEFIAKGNVIDLAVGVVIGGAFNKIVSALVDSIVMPPIGMITGKVDLSNRFFALDGKDYATLADAKTAKAPILAYGAFANTVLEFLIIAFVLFLVVRAVNKFRAAKEETTKDCPVCFTPIPIKAKRCPHCTSELTAEPKQEAAAPIVSKA